MPRTKNMGSLCSMHMMQRHCSEGHRFPDVPTHITGFMKHRKLWLNGKGFLKCFDLHLKSCNRHREKAVNL